MKEHTTQPTMAIEDNLGTNSKLRFKTHTAGEEIVKDWLKGNGAIRVDSCPGFDMAAFFDDGSMEVIKVETVVQYLAPHFKLSEEASSQLLSLYRQHEDVMLCPLLKHSSIKYRAYFVGLQTPYSGAVLFSCDLKDVEALLADGCNQHMIDTNNLAYVHHHAVQLRQKNIAKAYLDSHFSHPHRGQLLKGPTTLHR